MLAFPQILFCGQIMRRVPALRKRPIDGVAALQVHIEMLSFERQSSHRKRSYGA
jgi:hypothetical protein